MLHSWQSLCIAIATILIITGHHTNAATLDDWRGRTIYQVLTDRFARTKDSNADCDVVHGMYCGGSWKGIERKLDYIQGMNFDAIWISPIVAQLPQTTGWGEAYTGYWAQDLYALNDNFGTSDDLKSLIKAMHNRGMYLMLDIVVNHMGYAGEPEDVDYSVFDPFDNSKYFHSYCAVNADTNQTNVETCWLGDDIVALADLRTEDKEVQNLLGNWIRGLVNEYSIDGLRIDTAVNVEPSFYPEFVKAAGVFATGETMDGDNSFVCKWADAIGSVLNYPIYYPLTRAFSSTQGNINDLTMTINTNAINCNDPTAFGLFTENHDVERFPSMSNDTALAKNLLTFNIMGDGIPIIYQGQEQHMAGVTSPWTNRSPIWTSDYDEDVELYKHLATLIKLRKHMVAKDEKYTRQTSSVIYQDYHSFAMRKGTDEHQVITLFTNNGESSGKYKLDIRRHGYDEDTQMTEILTCKDLKVDDKGALVVPMDKGLPKVIVPKRLLEGSGLCGTEEATPIRNPPPAGTSDSDPEASETGSASERRIDLIFVILATLLSILLA
ncbi:unnamed protein product [Zymoseptoria tritici ST99CH_1A5]|uniref:alpha-amylase n=1 Tax=Zymoseptoria tritici ST99CH_1A5 TaxID=1276529 RepID=A0A1Y6LDU1_ZYMTR|nr:unnamed protein product [Zymoseptoria tritici ST99CH_1A5]